MDVSLTSFASALVKLAREKKDSNTGYMGAVAATAPMAAATALAEVPTGWAEKAVEHKINPALRGAEATPFIQGLGKGSARFGVGLLTTPIFVSGIQDLQSQDESTKRRGYAKVLGAGAAYGVGRGGVEAAIAQAMSAKPDAYKVLDGVRRAASAKGILGLGGAALTARSVAGGSKKKKEDAKGFLAPAAAGAAIGAGKGAIETAFEHGSSMTPRALAGGAAGKAVGGALGAVVIDRAFKYVTKGKEKQAEALDLYSEVGAWAAGQDSESLQRFIADLEAGDKSTAERTQPRRTAYYAASDELQRRSQEGPQKSDRSGYVKAPSQLAGLSLAALAGAPAVAAIAVTMLPPDDADHILSEALDLNFVRGRIQHGTSSTYSADAGKITTPGRGKTHAGLMAHEIGHATAGPTRVAISEATGMLSEIASVAGVVLPVLALISAADSRYASRKDLERRASFLTAVGATAGAAQLPRLAEEALASAKALSMLRSVGDSDAVGRVIRQAGPGLASYAAPVLTPFIAAKALRAYARRPDRRTQ